MIIYILKIVSCLLLLSFFANILSASEKVNLKILLKDKGLEKIVQRYLDGEIYVFENIQKRKKGLKVDIKSNKEACSNEFLKLSPKEAWSYKDAYKFPKALLGEPLLFDEFIRPVSVDITLDNLTYKPIFHKTQTRCQNHKCHIKFSLKKLVINSDLLIKNCINQKEIINIKSFQLHFDSGVQHNRPISYEGDLEIKTFPGQKSKIVFLPSTSRFNFPIGSVSLKIDGESDLLDLLEDDPEILKKHFGNTNSFYIYRYIKDNIFNQDVDWVSGLLYDIANKVSTKQINSLIGDFFKDLDFHSFAIETSLPVIKMMDVADESSILNFKKHYDKQFKKCLEYNILAFCYFSKYEEFINIAKDSSLDSVLDIMRDYNKKLVRIYKKLSSSKNISWKKEEVRFTLGHIKSYIKKTREAFKKIHKNMDELETLDVDLNLRHYIPNTDSSSSYLLFDVLSSEKLDDLKFKKVSHDLIPEDIGADYDLAVSLNLESINSIISWFHKNKYLDFCKNSYAYRSCKQSSVFETQSSLSFTNPPVIRKEKDYFVLEIKSTQADFKIWGFPTDWVGTHSSINLKIPFSFKIINNGHDLSFALEGEIESDYDFKDTTLKSIIPKILTIVHAPLVSIILGLNDHVASDIMKDGVNINDGESTIKRLVKIVPSRNDNQEVIVYMIIRKDMSLRKKREQLRDVLIKER